MNTEALREAAILDYKAAAAGERVSFDYDYVFMETCIDAGYSIDEAVDAALQKFKLYMSQEAKLCKRIGKEIKVNVKKKNYPEAIALAKKRLAHLENLLKRADEEIDDDEDFIISMESMAKSVIITMIVSAILVKVAEGIVPGSGWLLDAVKKGAKAVKIKAGKDGSFVREFIDPIMTIAGISKMVSKPIASHKMKKWQKERDGDINREYNEGRPDTTTLSVSRTQAKARFKKLIQAQRDEIRMLEEAQKLHNKPKNESVEPDEGTVYLEESASLNEDMSTKEALVDLGIAALLFTSAIAVRHFSAKRKEALERKAEEERERERAKKATAAEKASIRSAIMIANGNYDVKTATNIDKLKCAGCSAENAEKYFQKLLSKNASDLSEVEKFIDDAESVDYPDETMISAVKKHMNNPIYVIDVEGSYSITLYDAKTGKVHIITFGDGEEAEDFKTMYNKYVVPTDLRKHYAKKINEIKQSSRKVVRENADIIVEASILLKSGFAGTREEVLQEAKLKAAARNDLPDSNFGLPEDRKYPLNDAAHVKAAIKMFSHCPNDKKAKLAKRITSAMDKFGIDTKFNRESPMYDYISAKYRAE